ncbi:uncharacterized protein J3D65DRAFT_149278 [Phyllosticta citribraziliensis]|uniref:Uncharacterized protein n=1 Tax=Phyllosticta citribraziliensis TaxID=989973 RepID=A0ABR1L4N6_9PEZI
MAKSKQPPPQSQVDAALANLKDLSIDTILDPSIQPRAPSNPRKPQHRLRISEHETRILELREYPASVVVFLDKLVHIAKCKNKTPQDVKASLLDAVQRRRAMGGMISKIKEVIEKDFGQVIGGYLHGNSSVSGRKRTADERLSDAEETPRSKRQMRPQRLERQVNRLNVQDPVNLQRWNLSMKHEVDDDKEMAHTNEDENQAASAVALETQLAAIDIDRPCPSITDMLAGLPRFFAEDLSSLHDMEDLQATPESYPDLEGKLTLNELTKILQATKAAEDYARSEAAHDQAERCARKQEHVNALIKRNLLAQRVAKHYRELHEKVDITILDELKELFTSVPS